MTLDPADDVTTTDYVTDDPEPKLIVPCDSLLQEGCPCKYGHFGCPRGQVCILGTLPVKMFGPFWSVWCKMALAEVGVSLP